LGIIVVTTKQLEERTYAMKIIPQDYLTDKKLDDAIQLFFNKFNLSRLLATNNAYKARGVSVAIVFKYLLRIAFGNRSMYMNFLTGSHTEKFAKDVVYRFLNNASINWIKFTTALATKISNQEIVPLTDDSRRNVLIVDDTLFERPRAKRVELLARVFDHNSQKYKRGFRLLALGWSDGNTFLPVASRLMSSEKKSNIYHLPSKTYDKRTLAFRRRSQARSKATHVMIELLKEAKEAGIQAKHVLFDTWFCSPSTLTAIKGIGYDVIAMAKKTSKVHYFFEGKKQSAQDIFKLCKKRRGKSRYLLSVEIKVQKDDVTIPAKLVFVRNRNKRNDYLILISTDTSLTEDEIIQTYSKRWAIEVFFKVCKSYLKLAKESRGLSFDAMTAHVAIVFTRYMMMSVEHRQTNDERSLGQIFYLYSDEIAELSFAKALFIIMQVLLKTVEDKFDLTKEQLDDFLTAFVDALPNYMKNRLIAA